MRTRTFLPALSLIALAAVAGCGSDDDSSSGGANVLSESEVKSALITAEDLGTSFKVAADDGDDNDDENLGCLNGLDKLDDKTEDPVHDEDAEFETDVDPNLPGIFNTVGTFKTTAKATTALKNLTDAVADCSKVDVTDDSGFRLQLAVSSDQDKTDASATAQVNLEANGTAGGQGVTIPFSLRFSAIQIENQVTVVGFVTMADSPGADADAVNQRAYDRLAAVAAGKKVPTFDALDIEPVDLTALLGAAGAA